MLGSRTTASQAARMHWQWLAGALCGFLLALVTTPASVYGAVLLLPVQVSILRVPSPAVTPTNLLFNVFAVPGGLLRFWREGRLFGPLAGLLLTGTLPGVIAGAVLRVELLHQLLRRAPAEPHPGALAAPAARGHRLPGRSPLHAGGDPALPGAARAAHAGAR